MYKTGQKSGVMTNRLRENKIPASNTHTPPCKTEKAHGKVPAKLSGTKKESITTTIRKNKSIRALYKIGYSEVR